MASDSTSVVSTDIYKLTQFVEQVKAKYIDVPDETLYLGIFGYLNAIMSNALENAAIVASEYSNEAIPTKAKYEKNIIAHALALGIDKIFANPATIEVALALPKDIIDDLMVDNTFCLDKESIFEIGEDKHFPYKLDYDVIIKKNVLPNGSIVYSGRYDFDSGYNPIANYSSPYLPAIQLQEEGSQLLLHVWVTLRQITHTEIYKKILSNNPLETKVLNFSYSNQLAYFYVEVVETDSLGQKNVHILKPVYNGLYNDITATEEYINYLFLDDNNIRLTFDRESYQPRTNAEVTIHVFTTLGSEANFTLADSYRKVSTISSDRFNYNRLYYYLTTISDSVDGRNKLDVSALKTIIPQEALSRGSITTFTDLNNAFNSVQTPDIHIEFLKKVDNQVERLWYAYLLMKDDNGNIVPTNTITACFNKSIFSNTNKFNFILKPGTLFYQDPDTGVINGYTNDLTDDEKEKMDTDSFLFMTPFLTVITKSPFYASFYMTYIHYARQLFFTYINEDSLLQFSCLTYEFYRHYFPEEETGDTRDPNYIPNGTDTYHLIIETIQTLQTPFDLFVYDSHGVIVSAAVKMFAVFYQKNNDGEYYPYRYIEGNIIDNEEDTTTTIKFEFKFQTNDVISPIGNHMYITKGMRNIVNGDYISTYISPNVHMKIFILAKTDKVFGREYVIDTKKYNLDDLIPGLKDWSLTNVYESGEQGLDIFYDYSDMCNSYIELTKDTKTKENNFKLYKLPVVRATYIDSETKFQNISKLIDRRRKYIQNVLLLLEDSFGIDYKFFNTYGRSLVFNIDQEENIDRINLSLKFEVKFVTKSDKAMLSEIIVSIKDYIEDMNNITDLHMSNLITYITNLYRNNIIYIKFVRLNNYDSLYQSIYKNPVLLQEEFTDSQTVPEFINVNTLNDGSADITFDIVL